MITERTPSHSAAGLERRSAVSAIQSMSPCQPLANAASSFSRKSGRAAADVMPNASKPSVLARALSSSTRAVGSEIEIGIAGVGRHAADAVGEQRAEGRARLDARVPVPRLDRSLPVHVAEVVERAE